MGGPDVPSHTTTTTEVKLPEWVDKASQENYKFAQGVANRPLVQYPGSTVAPISQATRDAWQYLYGSMGQPQAQMGQASTGYQGVLGSQITPDNVTAGSLPNIDIAKYMNPYISNVENAAMGNLERQRKLGILSNADRATAAGAFGGDRSAVENAITNSEAARAAGELSANLRSAGYQQATGLAETDIGRQFAADTANQQAGLTAQQATAADRLAASQGLLSTGTALGTQNLRDYAAQLDVGRQQQDQRQKEIAADVAKFQEKQNYPLEQLNILLSSLGMSPYGQTTTTKADNPNAGGGGMDWLSGGFGVLSLLGGLFSEDTAKTDKQKVGKDPATGLDVYAFRYKGDPKSYPKVTGVMASQVEKKFPYAVRKIGRKRIIHRQDITKPLFDVRG